MKFERLTAVRMDVVGLPVTLVDTDVVVVGENRRILGVFSEARDADLFINAKKGQALRGLIGRAIPGDRIDLPKTATGKGYEGTAFNVGDVLGKLRPTPSDSDPAVTKALVRDDDGLMGEGFVDFADLPEGLRKALESAKPGEALTFKMDENGLQPVTAEEFEDATGVKPSAAAGAAMALDSRRDRARRRARASMREAVLNGGSEDLRRTVASMTPEQVREAAKRSAQGIIDAQGLTGEEAEKVRAHALRTADAALRSAGLLNDGGETMEQLLQSAAREYAEAEGISVEEALNELDAGAERIDADMVKTGLDGPHPADLVEAFTAANGLDAQCKVWADLIVNDSFIAQPGQVVIHKDTAWVATAKTGLEPDDSLRNWVRFPMDGETTNCGCAICDVRDKAVAVIAGLQARPEPSPAPVTDEEALRPEQPPSGEPQPDDIALWDERAGYAQGAIVQHAGSLWLAKRRVAAADDGLTANSEPARSTLWEKLE